MPGIVVMIPIRNDGSGAVSASRYDIAGAAGVMGSPTAGPATASSNAAASRTERVTANCTDSGRAMSSLVGPTDVRPRDVFNPTSPQQAAGMRIDPPPSDAWANGTMPAATAAAEPPLDPPGVRVTSHGLRVGRKQSGSVVGMMPSSGELVRPMITRPAA